MPFSSETIFCFTHKVGGWGAPGQHPTPGGGVGSEPASAEAQGRLSTGCSVENTAFHTGRQDSTK